ncbi:hypothetical protein ACLOJK_013082 [Asimina triloba]
MPLPVAIFFNAGTENPPKTCHARRDPLQNLDENPSPAPRRMLPALSASEPAASNPDAGENPTPDPSSSAPMNRCPFLIDGKPLGDGSGENLVVKRARVGVIPRWVTEQEVLSATPLGSIEARGNGGRRPVGVRLVGLPLCRNKSVRVGWADVGGAEAWASYQSIGTQSGQYLSSDPTY